MVLIIGFLRGMKKRHEQKLIIIAVLLVLAFNMPLLPLFGVDGAVGGFPVIYVYIFSVWTCAVLVSYLIVKRYYE